MKNIIEKVIKNEYQISNEDIEKYFLEEKVHYSSCYIKNAKNTLKTINWRINILEEISPAIICSIIEEGIKRSSLKTKLNQIHSFYKWKLGSNNSFAIQFREFIRKIKIEEDEPKLINKKHINFLLENLPVNYAFFVFIAINTTARRTSLCDLNIQNITRGKIKSFRDYFSREFTLDELEKDIIFIQRRDKLHGELAKKNITVPLLGENVKIFDQFISVRNQKEIEMKKKFLDEKGEYLFWNRDGERLNPESTTKYIERFSKENNFNLTVHDLRRYAIQQFRRKGLTREEITKFSGHSQKSNVIDRYLVVDVNDVNSKYFEIEKY